MPLDSEVEWLPLIGTFLNAGIVAQLPQELFNFLQQVQNKLTKVIKGVGKIEHSLYPFVLFYSFAACGMACFTVVQSFMIACHFCAILQFCCMWDAMF